jgi:hypothetical protein
MGYQSMRLVARLRSMRVRVINGCEAVGGKGICKGKPRLSSAMSAIHPT